VRTYPGAAHLVHGGELADVPYRPGPLWAKDDSAWTHYPGCEQNQLDDDVVMCEFGPEDAERTIAVVGASHAHHWLPALTPLGPEHGWRIVSITKSACLFSAETQYRNGEPYVSCQVWNDKVMATLAELAPDAIFTTSTRVTRAPEVVPDGYVTLWPDDDRLLEITVGDDDCVEFTLTEEDDRFEILVDNDVVVTIPPVVEEASITIVKEAAREEAEVGDLITYTYTVTNTGDVTLTDVTVEDDVLGEIALGATALEPGESTTGTATHPVTESDLDEAEVHNVAVAVGVPPEGEPVSAADEATVDIFEEAVLAEVAQPADEEELPRTGSTGLALLVAALITLGVGFGALRMARKDSDTGI
jgi:hypothetical protein